ncbi:hypothetical protein LTR62_000987 [Meristemomyces frigidus]|uniref:Uncharacterized protein n=1 Tax=Meristemomyces frigidus TaxID=1508187 RepID=A0AAN7T8F7_9PEZI|nr:hypothetical protein LTR62_000987 [Meristemomyces frigidus]
MFPSVEYPPLLHTQHYYYTSELAKTHQTLSKRYKKLGRVEKALSERDERGLNRKEKKKLQWAKSVTKSTIQKLEEQRAYLQVYLRQCNDLIAAYEPSIYHLPTTPWTAHLPQSPCMPFTPYSAVGRNPWHTAAASRELQYWDLSMLRERRRSSPNDSSADSGFYEPALRNLGAEAEHVFAHEIMSGSIYSPAEGAMFMSGIRSKKSSMSSEKKDDVPKLMKSPPVAIMKAGAMDSAGEAMGHRRRYSENAIQLIERRLATPSGHQRGPSVGPVPSDRTRSTQLEG